MTSDQIFMNIHALPISALNFDVIPCSLAVYPEMGSGSEGTACQAYPNEQGTQDIRCIPTGQSPQLTWSGHAKPVLND